MDDMFNNIGHHWPFHLFDEHPIKYKDLDLNPNIDKSDRVLTISGEKKTEHKEDKDSR